MLYSIYIKLFCWILLSPAQPIDAAHDFHLSKTDIHFKTDQNSLQFTVHTFIDDTESALKSREDIEYKFFESAEHSLTDSVFSTYLKEHFKIRVDGKAMEFKFLGKEQSDDIQGVYSYLEIEGVTAISELEVDNTILMDQFDDQKNIISVLKDNKREAFHILTNKDHFITVAL